MKGIQLQNITKSYDGKEKVIRDFDLTVEEGEFLVLLGPSGCGKSTLLRIIAGLEEVDAGALFLDGVEITDQLPKDRNIAMVFQNYALYPHMTVAENIGIALKLKKVPKAEIRPRVEEVARTLDIEALLDRKPGQLSGGQMQRVALARAIIRKPHVFLMDEPLSNLDAKLRLKTRGEIIKLYRRLGITTVYVTHDQVEAMTMATTIVLMKDGRVMQKGTPEELYTRPENLFTARFIGTPEMNLLTSTVIDGAIDLFGERYPVSEIEGPVIVGVRSEDIRLVAGDRYRVEFSENLGSEKLVTVHHVDDPSREVVVKTPATVSYAPEARVGLAVRKEGVHLFDPVTEERI